MAGTSLAGSRVTDRPSALGPRTTAVTKGTAEDGRLAECDRISFEERFDGRPARVVAFVAPRSRDAAVKQQLARGAVHQSFAGDPRIEPGRFPAVDVRNANRTGNRGRRLPEIRLFPIRLEASRLQKDHDGLDLLVATTRQHQ